MPDSHEITRPYPGLRPFESWEGEIFFGREEHTNRLLDILKERHFLAVIGPSGSGKSSLVRAGLLPALPLGSIGTGSDWRIALMRPGNRPIRSLAHALLLRSTLGIELVGEDRIPHNERELTPDVALIEADLRRGPLGLIDIVRDARTRQVDDDAFNLLILVDQFEELFTYADAGGPQADEAEAFVNLLLACQTVPAARIYVVLTMRTDFLGNCVRFLNLPDAINKAQYLTPRLTREQIERAIISPAYLFDSDVEPTLVTELINTASNDQDQLPILQHALSRMWDETSKSRRHEARLNWNNFNQVGGIGMALSQHADEILATLSPRHKIEQPLCTEQQAAMDLFRAITEQRSAEAGGQAVRRPQSLARIAKWSGRKWQDFIPVVMAYTREGVNFLHINEPLTSETIVDISHEALIRQWQRLRYWVTQETRLASEYQRFRERADAFRSDSGSLLTGADLARALEWRDGAYSKGNGNDFWRPNAQWVDRYRKNLKMSSDIEFNDVLKFIDDSHAVVRTARKRARIVKRTLITLTILSVITTIGSFVLAYQSHSHQIMAEAALLWTPLDFGGPGPAVTEEQAHGLGKLASASDAQRWTFFEQLLKDHALAERFSNNPAVITAALTGISPDRKNKLLARLHEAPTDHSDIARLTRFLITSELEVPAEADAILSVLAIKDKKDLPARKALGQRIETLIANMPEHELVLLASQLLASLNNPLTVYESAPRSEALAAIIARLPPEKLGGMADQLMTVIKITHDPVQLDMLKESFALLTSKMTNEQPSALLANQLLTIIKSASTTEQKAAFARGLENLASRLSPSEAERIVGQLVLMLKEVDDTYPFQSLGASLATLIAAMPEPNASTAVLANHLMTGLKQSTIPEQFDALGQSLAALAVKLPASEREVLTDQLIGAIKEPSQFAIIGAQLIVNFPDRFLTLGQTLAEMTRLTSSEKTETRALELFSDLMKPLEREQLNALSQGLAASAVGMTPSQADRFAERIITTMKNTKNGGQFVALGEGLAGVAKQMSAQKAEDLAQQLITLINSQEKKEYGKRFDALKKGLSEAAAKISAKQADALVEQLLNAINTSENRMQIWAFGAGAAKAASHIPEAQIVPKMTALLPFLADSDHAQLTALVKMLEAMAKNLNEDQALVLAEQLIAGITDLPDNPKDEIERIRSKTFGKGLKAISARVRGAQAKTLAGGLIVAIDTTKSAGKQEAFGQGLAAVCANLEQNDVADLAGQLIKAMQDSDSPEQFAALGKALSNAVEKLPDTQKTLAKQLADIIQLTRNSIQLTSLGQTLAVITDAAPPRTETIVNWFELLKNPLTPRPILAAAIRQRIVDMPVDNQDFWNLVQWAKQRFPQIDLENPPKDIANL